MAKDTKGKRLTAGEIVNYRASSPEMLAYLWLAMENRMSVVVCGPSGSGKTTVWDILTQFVPASARVERVEPSSKNPGAEMRTALDKKPDYLLCGKIQGEEARLAFQAISEGQAVCTAVHFPDVKAMINGLEGPPARVPRSHLAALNIVVLQNPVTVGGSKTRRMTQILEFVGYDDHANEIVTNWPYRWDSKKDVFESSGHSFLLEEVAKTRKASEKEVLADLTRRAAVIAEMAKKNVTDPKEAAKAIASYRAR